VDIFTADGGTLALVEGNLDECVLCRLCMDAVPGKVKVLKLYDGGAEL
jgi:NAD-dependent dihydropyrimidine dehydrogenase PreA subunit